MNIAGTGMHPIALTQDFGFFLVPGFSMMCFGSALEPLRIANRLCGRELYRWHIFTENQQPVAASNGMMFKPTRDLQDLGGLHTMLVVAGIGAQKAGNKALFSWLRGILRKGVSLGGVSNGSLLLAEAGVLKQRTCTIHWESCDSLSEQYPDLTVTGELYEIDQNILTCSGGLAGLDMMLHLIALSHGEKLAADVAEQCIHPTMRQAHEKQRVMSYLRHQAVHPRFQKALELMRENIEEVLSCQEISSRVGLSSRQMARLFIEHLGTSPATHYMNLRLERARYLLQQSTLPILRISIACGFSSMSHFARCYRRIYSVTPSHDRDVSRLTGRLL